MSQGFFFPNVTRLPQKPAVGGMEEGRRSFENQAPEEFNEKLQSELSKGLKFSTHATQRLNQRNIVIQSEMMAKVNQAIDQAAAKGVEESLILTPDAALIVNVANRTVITAIDRNSLSGNVFTNIDGAVIVN